jgi:hypothetical protein
MSAVFCAMICCISPIDRVPYVSIVVLMLAWPRNFWMNSASALEVPCDIPERRRKT